jgi:hypothetical protein
MHDSVCCTLLSTFEAVERLLVKFYIDVMPLEAISSSYFIIISIINIAVVVT